MQEAGQQNPRLNPSFSLPSVEGSQQKLQGCPTTLAVDRRGRVLLQMQRVPEDRLPKLG